MPPENILAMLDAGITGIAYETVQLPNGVLPLLSPMSEVAGRMSVQVGAALLQKYNGGMGILLGGVPGVSPAEVVIVDVAIDQGGSIATIDRVTTHDHPCYEKHGVIHYSVANIPGAVPRTATWALTNTTLPYLVKLADKGLDALIEDKALLVGLNLHDGKLTCEAVATAFDLPWTPAQTVLSLPN